MAENLKAQGLRQGQLPRSRPRTRSRGLEDHQLWSKRWQRAKSGGRNCYTRTSEGRNIMYIMRRSLMSRLRAVLRSADNAHARILIASRCAASTTYRINFRLMLQCVSKLRTSCTTRDVTEILDKKTVGR